MQFVKKLVILIGKRARGTLMLEKNGYGVWCKLNVFDLDDGEYRIVIISGDDMFVSAIRPGSESGMRFEVGEMDFSRLHVAVVGERVIMYGSNCAEKLPEALIMEKVNFYLKTMKNEEAFIKFSGKERDIGDYFKKIAPPLYNDFAIAERNYYPAYIRLDESANGSEIINGDNLSEETEIKVEKSEEEAEAEIKVESSEEGSEAEIKVEYSENGAEPEIKAENSEERTENEAQDANNVESVIKEQASERDASQSSIAEARTAKKEEREGKMKAEAEKIGRISPHELEQRYVRLMSEAAASLIKERDFKAHEAGGREKIGRTFEADGFANNKSRSEQKHPGENKKNDLKTELKGSGGTMAGGRKATYFERSSAEIERLMENNERFEPLEKLIPGSKFVKINYDQKRFYIVGVIGHDYICYGVPSHYSPTPPKQLSGYAKWLPLSADNTHGEGFWMMYQDGVSGETLKA